MTLLGAQGFGPNTKLYPALIGSTGIAGFQKSNRSEAEKSETPLGVDLPNGVWLRVALLGGEASAALGATGAGCMRALTHWRKAYTRLLPSQYLQRRLSRRRVAPRRLFSLVIIRDPTIQNG